MTPARFVGALVTTVVTGAATATLVARPIGSGLRPQRASSGSAAPLSPRSRSSSAAFWRFRPPIVHANTTAS